MKRNIKALAGMLALIGGITAGCGSSDSASGKDANSFDAVLKSNPNDASKGLAIPAGFKSKCDDLRAQNKDLRSKTYSVAVSGDSPPLAYKDETDPSKLLGFHPGMTELAMSCAGLNFKYAYYDFTGLVPALQNGRVDIQWRPIFFRPDIGKNTSWVIYQQNFDQVLTLKDGPNWSGWGDVCGSTIALTLSAPIEKAFLDGEYDKYCKGKKPIETLSFPTVAAMFQALKAKKVDSVGVSNAAAAGFSDIATPRFDEKSRNNIAGAAVMQKNDALFKAIYQGVKAVQDEGLQKALLAKYKAPENLFRPIEAKPDDRQVD